MSNAEHTPTHRPTPDAKFEPSGYLVAVQFFPQIKLLRKSAYEFVSKISGQFEANESELNEALWRFSQPIGVTAGGLFQIVVQRERLQFQASFPTDAQELLERRFEYILREFRKYFKSQLILASSASVHGVVSIDGDARTFLIEHVANINKDKLTPLARPIHLAGLRFFMPPYVQQAAPTEPEGKKQKPKKPKVVKQVDWGVTVRAESLLENPGKLFLEATGDWTKPQSWVENTSREVVERLREVSGYLKDNLLQFLLTASEEGAN